MDFILKQIATGLTVVTIFIQGFLTTTVATNIQNQELTNTPTGKCVVENSTKICELGYGDEKSNTSSINRLAINTEGAYFVCLDTVTKQYSNYSTNEFTAPNNPSFCVSDYGDIEISPSLIVAKHWGEIKQDTQLSYYVEPKSNYCIWTYAEGSGAVPNMTTGSSYSNSDGSYRKAFCWANEKVNIYSFKE